VTPPAAAGCNLVGVAALIAALWIAAGLVVSGEGRDGCPTSAAVWARLQQLAPEEAAGGPTGGLLVLEDEGGALGMRLLSPGGELREHKTLALRGSCEDLATAAATVVLAWQSRPPAGVVPPPVLAERAAANELPAAPARPPAEGGDALELSLGFHTGSGGLRWAPGILTALQAPIGRRVSLASSLLIDYPRTVRDGTLKRWSWSQATLSLAPSVRGWTDNFVVDGSLGLSTDFTMTVSESLSTPNSYRLIPPSLVAALRWTYARGAGRPWFAISYSNQLAPVMVSPIRGTSVEPERWMLGLALGTTFELERAY
jgi:hypothetical protein